MLGAEGFAPLLRRHMSGDWGDLPEEDKRENDQAILNCDRVVSAYNVAGGRVWVITEYDRSATTVLLPSEY